MKRAKTVVIASFIMFFFSFALIEAPAYGVSDTAIQVGATLEEFSMNPPKLAKEREYLGVKKDEPFTLSQLSAKLVLVEIFSVYCQTCQKSAPGMNKIFKLIQMDKNLKKDLKMLAIGQGDNQAKVDAWRKRYRIQFPLFPDPKREVFKKFGKPGTPYTVLIDANGKVLYAHGGQIKDIDGFIGELRAFHEKQ